MIFFVGLHHPGDAIHFDHAFISVNRVRGRRRPIHAQSCWILDSGAFTEISTHGHYRTSVDDYAREVHNMARGNMIAAVSQDYMCEPFIVEKTGLTVAKHQELTTQRYDDLSKLVKSVYLMPVLQGYGKQDYLDHLDMYDGRLAKDAWVGVGSVCKRNGNPAVIYEILSAITRKRPDLRLHGFGLKTTSLMYPAIRNLLYTADSMAWSFAARKEGRGPDANKWQEAKKFVDRINSL